MAGPTTIQQRAAGLLDLLGMQSTGNGPNDVAGIVAPVIDLKTMYLWDRARALTAATPVINAINPFATTVGPRSGEQWFLYGVSATTAGVLAAASTIGASFAINRGAATGVWQLITPRIVATAGELWAHGVVYEEPILLRGSDTIGVWVSQIAGVPGQAISITAWFAPVTV